MKYLRQFCIILLISALGEGLHILLPLPVPASVYGLVLMLGALTSGILKLEQVEDAADFLVEIMPVMFVPAGVGLLQEGYRMEGWQDCTGIDRRSRYIFFWYHRKVLTYYNNRCLLHRFLPGNQ